MANTIREQSSEHRGGMPVGAIVENGSAGQRPSATDLPADHQPSFTSHVPPTYRPPYSSTPVYFSSPHKSPSDLDPDSHSLTSQDSGIPTLEIHPPGCSALQPHNGNLIMDSAEDSPATLPLDDDPSNSTARKSSTFPRSSYDTIRLFSPTLRLATPGLSVGGGALNRSDDISMCSVSSMSTELSVSNEDILDFTVTSDSSAIVTLETDESGTADFSDVTLSSSPGGPADLWSPSQLYPGSGVKPQQHKKLGPLISLFNRSVFTKKVKDSQSVEPKDPGWKLFGKVPLRDVPIKDPKKIQKNESRDQQLCTGRRFASIFLTLWSRIVSWSLSLLLLGRKDTARTGLPSPRRIPVLCQNMFPLPEFQLAGRRQSSAEGRKGIQLGPPKSYIFGIFIKTFIKRSFGFIFGFIFPLLN